MDELTTHTDSAYAAKERLKVSLLIGLFMTFCNFLSLKISLSLFLMIEVVICFITFLCVQLPKRNQDWTLHFQEDELHITNNSTGDRYEVYAIPTTDFRFRQTKREKELDYGTLTIRRTIFGFPALQNVTAVKAYVQEHFSKYGGS